MLCQPQKAIKQCKSTSHSNIITSKRWEERCFVEAKERKSVRQETGNIFAVLSLFSAMKRKRYHWYQASDTHTIARSEHKSKSNIMFYVFKCFSSPQKPRRVFASFDVKSPLRLGCVRLCEKINCEKLPFRILLPLARLSRLKLNVNASFPITRCMKNSQQKNSQQKNSNKSTGDEWENF